MPGPINRGFLFLNIKRSVRPDAQKRVGKVGISYLFGDIIFCGGEVLSIMYVAKYMLCDVLLL